MESNYDILGIEEGAAQKDIRDAFRRMALQSHVDRGGENEKFIRIKQAYEDLKIGKKYPDTPLAKSQKSRVFSGDTDQEIRRRNTIIGSEISREMAAAQEWVGAFSRSEISGTRMFGSKTLGELEFVVKRNRLLHIKGNYMAGSFAHDGTVVLQGNVYSPSWAEEYRSDIVVTGGDFKLLEPLKNRFRVENGASVTAQTGNIVVGNVRGRKYKVDDPDGRVGLYETRERRTRLYAPKGRIVVENATDTVLLEGDIVMVLDMEDDVRVSAREVWVYGSKITYDCVINIKPGGTIRFFEEYSIIGLSDDAVITLDSKKKITMRSIKSKRIRDLRDGLVENPKQYDKNATMVGGGFVITYQMLDSLIGEPGEGSKWGRFLRRKS